MIQPSRASLLIAAVFLSGLPRAGSSQAARGPRAEDVASMEAILAALYDVISGPAGQARDWDRMRAMFFPGARLIPAVYRPDSVPTLIQWSRRCSPGKAKTGAAGRSASDS